MLTHESSPVATDVNGHAVNGRSRRKGDPSGEAVVAIFGQQRAGQRMTGGAVVFDGPPDDLRDHHLREIYGGEDWL